MQNHIFKAMSLSEYEAEWKKLVEEGASSGENQSETYVNFTKLNWSRHQRVLKKIEFAKDFEEELNAIQSPLDLIVITETWCGDAAQCVALLAKMEQSNPAVKLHILYRDQNLELMDRHLTNGGRSIPKVLFVRDGKVLAEWGPRPKPAQFLYDAFKANPAGRVYQDIQIDLQKWYTADKTLTQQQEVMDILMNIH